MNIFQFLRIFWARRITILVATVSCVLGALVVMTIMPPRWSGTARVILNTLKPDPVTGLVLGRAAGVYTAMQTSLVTDYSVAGRVADQLGWLSDPNLIRQYNRRSSGDTRDFRHWVAYNVIQKSSADVVAGTNILEIHYASARPDEAKAVADALRRADVDVNLQLSRDNANLNADWYSQQAQKAREGLDQAQQAVAVFEKANNIAIADERESVDADSMRLRALSAQGALPPPAPLPPMESPAAVQLAQVDGELAQALRNLGPNHPDVQALRAKRASLATLAATEESKRTADIARQRSDTANTVQQALQAQKTKVAGEKDKIDELTRLQSEVTLRQAQFQKTQAKAVELRQEAAVADAGMVPLGAATVPPAPDFPNTPLIVIGAIVLGLGMGSTVALLSELLARRVRGVEDLQGAIDAPMLAVISAPAKARAALPRRGRSPMNWPSSGRKAVQG